MGLLHREKHDDDVVVSDDDRRQYPPEDNRDGREYPHDGREYPRGREYPDDTVRTRDETVRREPVPERVEGTERTERAGTGKVREREWTFAPGQLVSLAAGIAFVVVGVIALIRCGIDGSFDEPVEQVLGWDHTAWLGLAEVGFGLLLILAGAGPKGRPLSVLLGAVAVIAGVIVLAEPDAVPDEFGVERDFGWALVAAGAVVALAALMLPVWRSRHVNRDEIDLRDRDTVRT